MIYLRSLRSSYVILLFFVFQLRACPSQGSQTTPPPPSPSFQNSKLGLISLHKLGKFSASSSSLRVISSFKLQDLGANLLLSHYVAKMARKAWSFEYLDNRLNQDEQEKQIARPWLDFNDTETDNSFKTLLAKYKPLLDQKVALAEHLIQKYRSLVSSMSSGYDIRTLQPTNNFLLDLIDAQKKQKVNKLCRW